MGISRRKNDLTTSILWRRVCKYRLLLLITLSYKDFFSQAGASFSTPEITSLLFSQIIILKLTNLDYTGSFGFGWY
jgi:hypothetical protein